MPKVLVADDEPALLEALCEVVAGLGCEVLMAADGQEALAVARRERPDLAVLDHMMPLLTGVEVLRSLRQTPELDQTPVILMSAIHPRGRHEAWRFLQKPVALKPFEQVVREALAELKASGRPPPPPSPPTTRVELAREEMLNWIAHEIRSPLSAASLNAELALREPMDDKLRRKLQTVTRNLGRMEELLTSVLDAARLQDGKLQLKLSRVDACELVRGAVSDWREAQPTREFRLDIPAAPVFLLVDRTRVRQIVENLVSNAVKYTPPGQPIEVALRQVDGQVRLDVVDRGPGIAKDEQRHIFERFHRVEGDRGRGHGLGLYIASTLARLHGGALEVRSRPGEGSTFSLLLPVATTSVDALATRAIAGS